LPCAKSLRVARRRPWACIQAPCRLVALATTLERCSTWSLPKLQVDSSLCVLFVILLFPGSIYTAYIDFTCGASAGAPVYSREGSGAMYFLWSTMYACNVSGPTTPPIASSSCVIDNPYTGEHFDLSPLKGTTYVNPAGYYSISGSGGYLSYYSTFFGIPLVVFSPFFSTINIALCGDELSCNYGSKGSICGKYNPRYSTPTAWDPLANANVWASVTPISLAIVDPEQSGSLVMTFGTSTSRLLLFLLS